MSVQGQVVVVTGSAKGIGRFIAGTFAQAGARMALADVDADRLEKTAAEMRGAGTEVVATRTDVSDEAALHPQCLFQAVRLRLHTVQQDAVSHRAIDQTALEGVHRGRFPTLHTVLRIGRRKDPVSSPPNRLQAPGPHQRSVVLNGLTQTFECELFHRHPFAQIGAFASA